MISEIKSKLKTEIGQKEPKRVKLNRYRAELNDLLTPQLFEFTKKEQKERQKRIEFLHRGIKVLEDYFQEICSNKIYLGAFEWRLEFPEVLDDEGNFIGFDCIIGNPPYIQLQSIEHDADILERMEYETYARTGDIYCLFYEQGMNVLKENGCLCYITSNKWMRAGYGENLRNYFATKTNPTLLVDFAGVKIFDAATVEANILLTNKEANKYSTLACIFSDTNGLSKLSDFIQQWHIECAFRSSDSWVILSPIEQSIKRKIEAVGTPLKNWNININYGIKTGYNDAFIINTEKREEILRNCRTEDERQRTAELIRPILRGRDIKRYGYNWDNLWLINTHNGIKGVKPRININEYSAVKAYLDQHWDKISKRADKGDTPYNLRNCAYMEDFYKPKIVWGNLNLSAAYSIAADGIFVNAPCPMIVPASKYLLAILNSKVADYYIRQLGVTRNGGYFEYKPMFVENLPVPNNIDCKTIEYLEACVNSKDESSIDKLVYNLYKLTDDEIRYIEKGRS